MSTSTVPARLRRAVLASCVLDDLDVEQAPWGVTVAGERPVRLDWRTVSEALAEHDPLSPAGRARVSCLLELASLVAADGLRPGSAVRKAVKPVALPPDHVLHPGPEWVRRRVLGGALEVGLGLPARAGSDLVLPVPGALLAAAGADVEAWWEETSHRAEHPGSLVAGRVKTLARRGSQLRPVGGCDILTLLTCGTLRAALAGLDGTGMCAVAVPERTRGWFDLSRIDPAFTTAAWSATAPSARGVARPLLVTEDEVVLARPAARPWHDAH